MVITKETKQRFVDMLLDKQILVVRTENSRRECHSYKFIGANNDGKWDFTPMVSEYVNYRINRDFNGNIISIRAYDGTDVIRKVLEKMIEEGIGVFTLKGDDLYFKVRDLITFFYI